MLTGARKKVYKDFGRIFGDSGSSNDLLTMYLSGIISDNDAISLYLYGSGYPVSGQLALMLYNDTIYNDIPFFTSGLGGEPGAIPINETLYLYIHRANFTNILSMYTIGVEGVNPYIDTITQLSTPVYPGRRYGDFNKFILVNHLNLNTFGHIEITGTLPLYLYNGNIQTTKTLIFYSHGF